MQCYKCKKEINIVSSFRCALCGNTFCAEHHLPENHQCPEFPILLYQKKKKIKESFAALGLCPKCRSPTTDMIHYDAKTMTFKCKECGRKFTQLKEFPYRVIEIKEEPL